MHIKNYITTILLILLVWSSSHTHAQTTVAIPDDNFRSKLLTSYPQFMVGGKLDTVAAYYYNGELNLQYAEISDIEGIQYFKNINSLNLKDNNLRTFPQLSALKQLQYLFLSRNKLDTLPDISGLDKLFDFQAQYNNLTSLPSFNNQHGLFTLYCNDNKLKSLPDLSNSKWLMTLVIGNNPFEIQPDFSALTNITQLHIHQTGCDSIRGISKLKKIEVLYAWGNKLNNLSSLDSITTLKVLNLHDNRLSQLPYLLNKPNLISASFTRNHLTFEDIAAISSMPYFSYYNYSSQHTVPMSHVEVREKDNVTMAFAIDSTIANCTYKWFKNGLLIDSTAKPKRIFQQIQFSDSGFYHLEITNSSFPDLKLMTDSFKVVVKPCLQIKTYTINESVVDCSRGFNIVVENLHLGGGLAPFTYQLLKNTQLYVENSLNPDFQNISSGLYQFKIVDSRQCSDYVSLAIPTDSDCDLVFTPNGDGIMDTYFVDEPGEVQIFDTARNLVAKFQAPAEWNGVKSDGQMADSGLYAVVINQHKVIQITLIR